ncbi:MAG: flagellar basal body P-ring formation protein FlgA [bacterium]|nr:flagellar basal body P-ring formation protein FlgA [bacterium]
MKARSIKFTAIVLLLLSSSISAETKAALTVHLPRSVRINGKDIRLGALAIIRGDDDALVTKASNVAMGRTPWSKEKIVIDRRTIASRLVASGIKAADVRLIGAEQVVVERDDMIVDSKRLIKAAEDFVRKIRPASQKWRVCRAPKDMVVPGADDIQLKPRLGAGRSTGYVHIEVAAISGGNVIGVTRISFRQLYDMRQLVATKNLASGDIITSENTKLTVVSVLRKPPEWRPPYGLKCTKSILSGAVIPMSLLKTKKPVVLIKKNKAVQIKIQMNGFVIVATGKALQDGKVGDLIKVQNIDSKRTIIARVGDDGTVTPAVYNSGKR